MDTENQGVLQTVSLLSVALIALVMGVQKLIRDWRTTKAESDIISIMHKEIERMSVQNSTLSIELGKLQEEIIELNNQVSKLNIENNKLREEISTLTTQLNNFRKLTTLVSDKDVT
jgi:septal ring factor EnvC (AmiA/AmiB activator)